TATTGAPVLEDALAWLDCTIYTRHQAGTHTIYVGEVQASSTPNADQLPLVYWNRGYRRLVAGLD
ncbi:MAG: flavin reductase family protein, partial [Acidobacteria bacterium]|nr:flavin reductase family protein [Acidobacteriota bacterium]